MIERSFLHLPGIGPETEERLWSSGVRSWTELRENLGEIFGRAKASRLAEALEESRAALEASEFSYFRSRLKGSEIWRLVPSYVSCELRHRIAYLDIETTGLGFPPESHSTTIAVLIGGNLFVEHEPARKRELIERLQEEAAFLVTFNGGPFDLPFLRREFGVPLDQPHLDLRFWFARLGRNGGLKKIQRSFDEIPQRQFMDIDGYDAVRLWAMHERGVPRALESLMTYNAEDTVVLEPLLYSGLNLESAERPGLGLPVYDLPPGRFIPTRVCPDVYRLLRGH